MTIALQAYASLPPALVLQGSVENALLFRLRDALAAAMREPLNDDLWDHAGYVRELVRLDQRVMRLLQHWGIDLDADLDRLHHRLKYV